MSSADDCLFCNIVAGTIPAEIVYQNDLVLAFRDISPKAPTHLLVIPKLHAENAVELAHKAPASLTAIYLAAGEIAKNENLDGYISFFTTGETAGQTVFHAHLHLLSGRPFSWLPF